MFLVFASSLNCKSDMKSILPRKPHKFHSLENAFYVLILKVWGKTNRKKTMLKSIRKYMS